jgi:hypothetical protein
MHNELEMWKEAMADQFEALCEHLPGGIKGNHEKPLNIASVLDGIQTGHLPNTSQKCYSLSNLLSLTNM